jgi:hypothetical protein
MRCVRLGLQAIQPLRGECPTAPGGLPASTQTAQAVATSVVASGAGEVGSGLAPSADVPAAPAVLGGHLFPLVLLVLWTVSVAVVAGRLAYGQGWGDAYPLGVEDGARAVTIEAYQQGREAGQDEGYRTGLWDCRIETGRVL